MTFIPPSENYQQYRKISNVQKILKIFFQKAGEDSISSTCKRTQNWLYLIRETTSYTNRLKTSNM
jgi:hypothetical protein